MEGINTSLYIDGVIAVKFNKYFSSLPRVGDYIEHNGKQYRVEKILHKHDFNATVEVFVTSK